MARYKLKGIVIDKKNLHLQNLRNCQCSPTVYKRSGSKWKCLWGHALKRSTEIHRKSSVLYPGSGFLFSDKWPVMPKKHLNGLIIYSTIPDYIYRGTKVWNIGINFVFFKKQINR